MARNKGTFPFAANFEVKAASPLDPRGLVEKKSELISKDTWPLDGDTLYIYKGLLVSVQEEKAIYMLVDPDKILETDYSGWERKDGSSPGEVSYEDIYIIEGLTAQDIEGYVGGQLPIDGRGLSEAINSNKRVYIKYSNNAGAGIIPCSAYRDDLYYIAFSLGPSLYGFDIDADFQYIDENYIFHIDIQEKLESGINIKTINGQSILGRGGITIEGLPSATPDWNENNPSAASYIKNRTHYKVEDISYGTSMGYGDYYNDDDTPITPNRIRVRSEEGFVSDWINVYDGYGEYFEELYLYDEYGDIQDTYSGDITVDMYTSGVELSMGTANYYVDLDYSTIKKLSEEFIPDTIARKSDLENIGGGGSVDSEEIIEIKTTLESHEELIEDLQNMKIDKENDDYYPQMSVGTADNLAGQGEATPSEFTTRQSGGGAILDGTARIEAIKGNSVVWNQLLDTSEYVSHQNGIDVTKDDNNNFVVNGTTNTTNENGEFQDAWIKCHKGIFTLVQGHKYLITGCPKGGSGTTYSLVEGNGIIQPDFGDGRISECSRDIVTVMYIVVRKNTTVTNLKYCPFMCDLTKMFGAGNEPATVEEFYQRLPIEADDRYYVEGEMFHFRPTGIWSYDKSGSTKRLQDLSIVLALFPDGMKSTGTVNDEIRWNAEIQKWEKIQRVEEVYLGDLNYSKSSAGEYRFYTIDLRDKIAKNTESLISTRFIYGQPDDDKTNVNCDTTGTVFFSLPSCTDVAAFKEAVQGVTLCYELATPKTTILDANFALENGLNVDFNLDYQVWNGGREELVADNPSSALKADIVYGFNAYGKIQENSNKIEVLEKNKIVVDSDINADSDNPISNKLFTNSFTYLGSAIKGVGDDVAALETEVSNKEDKPIEIVMIGVPADTTTDETNTDVTYYLNKTNIGLSEEDSYEDYYQKILYGNVVLAAGLDYNSTVNKSVYEDHVTFNVAPQFTEDGIANGSITIYSSLQTSPNGAEYYVEVRIWLTTNSGGESGGGSNIEVDAELSDTSTNPVQNKVINEKLTELSAEIGKKVDADFVNNAIAESLGIIINGDY